MNSRLTCPAWIRPIIAHAVCTKFDRFPSSGTYSYIIKYREFNILLSIKDICTIIIIIIIIMEVFAFKFVKFLLRYLISDILPFFFYLFINISFIFLNIKSIKILNLQIQSFHFENSWVTNFTIPSISNLNNPFIYVEFTISLKRFTIKLKYFTTTLSPRLISGHKFGHWSRSC